jgi:polysaccharide biosynthesis protein PslH
MRPATQGNAVAIGRFCRILKGLGFELHVVYSAMEGIHQSHIKEMVYDCDILDVLPYPGHVSQPDCMGYSLDDWFDPAVSDHIKRLCEIWNFDLVIINYVWMSAAARAIPIHIPKILFSHDRFANRHLTLARAGIDPTWYSIAKHDEAVGLNRFDYIIAVTDAEADEFRMVTPKPVYSIGMVPNRVRRTSAANIEGQTRKIGYFGSSNPSNIRSLERLLLALEKYKQKPWTTEIVLAGPICHHFSHPLPMIKRLGVIEDLNDLYKSVHVVINPEAGGTGLRMKTIEILAADVPLLATREAMSGLGARHPLHMLDSPEDLANALYTSLNDIELSTLVKAGRELIDQFVDKQSTALHQLLRCALPNFCPGQTFQ